MHTTQTPGSALRLSADEQSEILSAIATQGGRYEIERFAYVAAELGRDVIPCDSPGCHGTEGVSAIEAGHTGFLSRIDRFHPGDYPCTKCGGTGFRPDFGVLLSDH